ncbi:prepilin peptidase [Streptomyces sp. KR80]|uniref:prepilin peptidase n=1 Tax=Streptomyces sp. KR80 TaxID=3457426 RepID=UPI003FD40A44
MLLLLIVLAAGYGGVAGLLVPRAAYRLAVEPEEPWRVACPGGHVLSGPARGWLGLARCAACAAGASATTAVPTASATTAVPTASADRVPETDARLDDYAGAVGGPESCAAGVTPSPAPRARVRSSGWYGPWSVPTSLGAALACAALAAAAGARPELAVWLLLVPFFVVLTLVDGAVHRLPDVLTLPLLAAAAALLGAAALLPGHAGSWTRALLGGLALGGAYLVLFLVHPSGMGFGDVKLALTLGVVLGWYGWPVLFAGAFAGFLLGALYGMGLVLTRRGDRKTALPFGPFMVFGALLGVLLGGLGAA